MPSRKTKHTKTTTSEEQQQQKSPDVCGSLPRFSLWTICILFWSPKTGKALRYLQMETYETCRLKLPSGLLGFPANAEAKRRGMPLSIRRNVALTRELNSDDHRENRKKSLRSTTVHFLAKEFQ